MIITGETSTLKNYRKIALLLCGDKNGEVVKFFDEKIKESPNGEDEEVIADERQMMYLILKMIKDDLSIFMTDAWYEDAGTQNAGTYQAFPLFIQKTRENKIPLQNTIHKMTGATADRFKVKNRGYIKEGYAADITIFNYEEIKINPEVPYETPQGMKYVIVNGEITIDQNQYTGSRKGVVLTRK